MDKIKTPEPRKIVDINNRPISSGNGEAAPGAVPPESLDNRPLNVRIAAGLRGLADMIENGKHEFEFVMLMPKSKAGETSFMYLGDPIPTVMLEGILHKVLTRMALQ